MVSVTTKTEFFLCTVYLNGNYYLDQFIMFENIVYHDAWVYCCCYSQWALLIITDYLIRLT